MTTNPRPNLQPDDDDSDSSPEGHIHVDFYGVQTSFAPAPVEQPKDQTWKQIYVGVLKDIKRVVAGTFRLLASTIESAECLVVGIAKVPGAIAKRVGDSHDSADRAEGVRQERAKALGPPSPKITEGTLQELIASLVERGLQFTVERGRNGQIQVTVVTAEDAAAAKVASQMAIQQLTHGLQLSEAAVTASGAELQEGKLIKGKVIGMAGDDVVVDVGLKSEGLLPREEFEGGQEPRIGDLIDVLIESYEDESGLILLSKRKADRLLNWRRILDTTKEGDVVEGTVTRKIKGGLLVDIGVPVFLPASQVDIRRPGDVGEFLGRKVRACILKIDLEHRNIVISRRKLIENERQNAKKRILDTIKDGDIITGEVKTIADFGAFIDVGGIDGLLHITDMSWGRINHPSEMLKVGQKIELKVLTIDREKEKIALGLKQKETSPWEEIERKYPINSRVKGTVVSIMSYGAFLRLEDSIEGLVHISDMSWTRKVNHPNEVVKEGDEVEAVVLEIDKDKQQMNLGMKQMEVNPWELVSEKYPPGTIIEGQVRNLANYGAFVEIEPGIDGLLHIRDISWTKKITHPQEVYKKSDSVRCVVLEVDQSKQRISLGIKQLTEDPWLNDIPKHYKPGMVVRGRVSKVTNFGVFVEFETDIEGLLHISELADHKVDSPLDVVKPDEEIDVKILRVDTADRKIGVSLKRARWSDSQ